MSTIASKSEGKTARNQNVTKNSKLYNCCVFSKAKLSLPQNKSTNTNDIIVRNFINENKSI
jgi:hypothetical protein